MLKVKTKRCSIFPYIVIQDIEYFKRKGIKYWLYYFRNRKYIVEIEKVE